MKIKTVRAQIRLLGWLVLTASFLVRMTKNGYLGGTVKPPKSWCPRRHIVVAHCTEDLHWMDQYFDFDPEVCRSVHFHVYSKCNQVPDLNVTTPNISGCSTVHVLKNFGTEEYAYLRYIEEHYAMLPQSVSFIQGGALTENPHIIYDTMQDLPGEQYKSLSRHVDLAWHFVDYNAPGNGEKKILDDLGFMEGMGKSWVSAYRGMFAVSGDRIKRYGLNAYADINVKIREKECETRNCLMETYFSPLFGCEPSKFQARDNQKCTSGVFKNVANTVFEDDHRKNACCQMQKWHSFEDTKWLNCGNETLLYALNNLNGALMCIEHTRAANSTEHVRRLYLDMIAADVWKANLTSLVFHAQSQWEHHELLQW
mmetsp:Transcript_38979/g.93363  ORF Transcript_38979/g.93363 Transcript_38979/m.93363 type:complete len:368 (+) Transcript_38979:178-1281(+)